jgi:MFS family permease
MAERIISIPVKTPFRRLTVGVVFGYICLYIALMTPGIMLLPFKLMEIDPTGYTASFGLVSGISALFALIGNPLGGAISDRTNISFGRRRTWILIGSLIGSASLLWIGKASSVWEILIATCFLQFFLNFVGAAYTSLIPDQVSVEKQGTISGLMGLSLPIGMVIGMGTMMAMTSAPSFTKWLIVAIFGAVGAVVSTFLIRDGKVEIEKLEIETETLSFKEKMNKIYPNPRKYPEFSWAIVSKFLLMMGYFSILYLSVMLVNRLGMDQTEASNSVGVINMIGLAGAAIASVLGGIFSDRIKKQKPFLFLSAVAIVIGLLIFAFVPSYTAVIVAVAILGIGQGCFGAVDTALVARILPNKLDASKDFGILNVANALPQSIIPALAPLLLNIGGWTFFYLFLVGCVILAMTTLRPLPEIGQEREDGYNEQRLA